MISLFKTRVSIVELLEYARNNPKEILSVYNGNLLKLNYTKYTQYKKKWNEFTLVSRGIIINECDHSIIAYPFNKFFNDFEYQEMGVLPPSSMKYWTCEKLDGILIIPYYLNDNLRFSTRGSFDNEYIDKAYSVATFDELPLDKYSFMFELISPDFSESGHLVTRYERDDLVLIGLRDMKTLEMLTPPEVVKMAKKLDLSHYEIYEDLDIDAVKKLQNEISGDTLEGWTIFFENGFMMKIKRREYLNLFTALKKINVRNILKTMLNDNYDNYVKMLPEELVDRVKQLYDKALNKMNAIKERIIEIHKKIPPAVKNDRKEFFNYVNDNYPSEKRFLAALYLGKDINKIILESMLRRS